MQKLEVGEKYLKIIVLNSIRLAAFKNKDKLNPQQPDYQGNGLAVWICEKKSPQPKEEAIKISYEDII